MVSARQIKAARALLGWTQETLAKTALLHLNAINKIEKDQVSPRQETLGRIQACFEANGIRFRGLRGVEIAEDSFELFRFEGTDCLRRLTNDIVSSVTGGGDEILNVLADEYLFDVVDPKQAERYAHHLKKTGARERYLTDEKQRRFRRANKAIYRGLPREVLGTISYVVYARRVAFINWSQKEVLIVRNASLATTHAAQFDFLWGQAKAFR